MAQRFKLNAFFRKNRKRILAILTLVAMFTFSCVGFVGFGVPQLLQTTQFLIESLPWGVSDWPVLRSLKRTQIQTNALFQFKGGTITEQERNGLLSQRQITNTFIQQISLQSGARSNFTFGSLSTEEVIMAELFRWKGRQLGLQVSNENVSDFIRQLTASQLTQAQYRDILNGMPVNENTLFAMLAEELLAHNTIQLLMGESPPLTPIELYDSYHKLKDKMEIEIAALPVTAFVDPSEEIEKKQLFDFFDRYKSFHDDPLSPVPGFRKSPRVNVEYIKTDFEKTRSSIAVSEEDVVTYYEENKENYRLPDEEETTPNIPFVAPSENTADPSGTDSPEKNESETETPESESSETDSDSPEKNESETETPESESEGPPAKTPDSSDIPEEAEGQESERSGESSKKNNPDPDDCGIQDPADAENQNQALPSENSNREENNAEIDSDNLEKPAQIEDSTTSTEAVPSQNDPATNEDNLPRYRVLDDSLKEEITEQIRNDRTRTLIDQLYEELQYNVFDRYSEEFADWELKRQESNSANEDLPDNVAGPKPEGPFELFTETMSSVSTPPELLKTAIKMIGAMDQFKGVVLEHGETGLVTFSELQRLDTWNETLPSQRNQPFSPNARPGSVVGQLFQIQNRYQSMEASEVYSPDNNGDSVASVTREKGSTYLYWITSLEPIFNPDDPEKILDEVRRVYQFQQARNLAHARAGELVQLAREKGGTLEESLANITLKENGDAVLDVQRSESFSWLRSEFFRPPVLSEVDHTEDIDNGFMQRVFSLEEGQLAIVANGPETVWYIVRAAIVQPAPRAEFIRENFHSTSTNNMFGGFSFRTDYEYLTDDAAGRTFRRLMLKLQNEAGFKSLQEN
ncbi:MAG: hypothetical protein MK103_08205 [Planctomycetes bacterium]|nr:hypothetical protein [Planctomycetota bacterium]